MTVLVTGATGQVGRHVVRGLLDGGERVRALTRSPGQADLPEGAEVVAGDLARPETLAGALAGVERMYLFPVPETAAEVLALARSAGVRRVVVLSSSSAEGGDEHDFSYAMHRPVERAAEESGLEWVHVRGGEFMANTLAWWAPAVREEGVVREIHGDVPHAPVHERDIADVAVAALRPGGPAGVAYTVHGPEPVTPVRQAELIGEVLGREVRFEELTPERAREIWIGRGMPAHVADALLQPPAGPPETMSQQVRDLIGHPGRTWTEWVTDHRAAFT